jgi:hypothetical protein
MHPGPTLAQRTIGEAGNGFESRCDRAKGHHRLRLARPCSALASGENHTLESGGNARSVRRSVLIRGYQASDSFH